jgi:hypothetical protein
MTSSRDVVVIESIHYRLATLLYEIGFAAAARREAGTREREPIVLVSSDCYDGRIASSVDNP